MKGTEAARRMRLAVALVRDRESISDDELAVILGLRLGGSPNLTIEPAPTSPAPDRSLSNLRAEAGRLGGLRSAESRQANGKQTGKQNEANGQANLKQNGQANLGFASPRAEDLTLQDSSGSSSADSSDSSLSDPLTPTDEPKQNGKQTEQANSEANGDEPTESEREVVRRVFTAWQEETGHTGTILDRKRGKRIQARLREGFTPERLIRAIANRRNDPHLMGQNDTGRVYDGIETLLRDAAQVERLERLNEPQRPRSARGAPQPKQPNAGQWKPVVES
jgi:hypothetical protein